MTQRRTKKRLDSGQRLAVLFSVNDDRIQTQGGERSVTRWLFLVDSVDVDGGPYREIEALSGADFEEGSQEYRWATALMGVDELPETFDDRELIGLPCNVDVVHRDGKAPGQVYVNVGDVRPIFAGQKKNEDTMDTLRELAEEAMPSGAEVPF